MYSKIWIPGTNKELDDLFEYLRQIQYNNKDVPLWQNYNAETFTKCTALTITFNQDHTPEFCASIRIRDCWPKKVYRICDRLWRHGESRMHVKNMPGTSITAKTQFDWLKTNTDMELVFVSRESQKWQRYTVAQLKKQVNLDFNFDSYKYKTCATLNDDSCWQYIIYSGNTNLLKEWQRR